MSTSTSEEFNRPSAIPQHSSSEEVSAAGNSVDFEKNMQAGQSEQNLVTEAKKTSNCGGIINLFKGYVGVGILALPYTFNEAGYLYGIIFLCVLGLIVYYTNILLIRVGDRILKKGETYIDICDKILSPKLAFVMRIFFLVGCLGACISFVLFFVKFFENAIGDALPSYVNLLFALCIIFPMSFLNDLGRLVKFTFFANTILFVTITTIFVYNFMDIFTDLDDELGAFNRNKDNMIKPERAPLMIGVGLLAFDAIYIIMGVRDQLKKPEQFTTRVLNLVNFFVALLYISFSVTTVLARGHKMEEITLFAMPDNWYIQTLSILYAIALAISYPLFLLCGSQMIEKKDNCIGKYIHKTENKTHIVLKRTALRTFLTLIVLVLAFLIPRFAIALNIFGSISGASLQFFLPLYSYYVVFKKEMSTFQKVGNALVLLVGVGGCILGLYSSISELVNPSD